MLRVYRNYKGFTLVEIIIVLTIVTILSAYAIPTFIGHIEAANQTKRMNIAKTIYLAAQNQLTEKRINKTLDSFSGKIDSEESAEVFAKKVSEKVLPDKMSKLEKDNIVYMSKKQGINSGKVYELLDDVIQDKTVLNNAILIEYNKSTGFVLSVFYSEEKDLEFNYKDMDKNLENFKTENITSVSGKRPYLFADERRQGYCGIEDTGMIPPQNKDVIINIKDGSEKEEALFYEERKTLTNVLYAEVLMKVEQAETEYDLNVISVKSGEKIENTSVKIIPKNLSNSLDYAIANLAGSKKHIVFKSEYSNAGKKLEEGYIRVIWILDYVKGDMLSQDTSIGKLYPDIAPQDIKVNISGGSINATSMSSQNSHYAYENTGINFINSARHLNNVRYKLDGSFRQIHDIDMNPNENDNITNFLPIGNQGQPFLGKYIARKEAGVYSIKNLKVDLTSSSNKNDAGLFGVVGKDGISGEITGIRLENPNIKAASNVGTLAGQSSGKISLITVENNKTSAEPIIKGDNNIGGIIGLNSGILNMLEFIDKSNGVSSLIEGTGYRVGGIVGGTSGRLSNAIVISASMESLVKSDYLSHLGGIVGESSAEIKNVIYLAIAPKNGTTINPIAGTFSPGTIDKDSAIYLSGEAKRPTPIKPPSNNEYNLEKANFGEPKSTKNIIKEVNFRNWEKSKASNEINMLSIYPYPYQLTVPYKETEAKNWPVVDEDGGVAEIGYYEMYSDDTWGYSNSKTHPLKTAAQLEKVETDKNVHVINDGYFIEYPKTNGEYTFEVKSSDDKIIYTLRSTDWNWNDKVFGGTRNIEPVEYEKDGKTYIRLFLRNNILESAVEKNISGNSNNNLENSNQITIIVKKGTIEILNTKINPLFAPIEPINKTDNIIRSPRHLDNIDKITVNKNQLLPTEFLQELNLDFEKYTRELKLEENKISIDDLTKISSKKSIVEGEFAGIYNGNNKYIRNVTVDSSELLSIETENTGLFSAVKGRVKDSALLSSNFKGKQIVGGIVGTLLEGAIIENCELSEVIVENTGLSSLNATGGIIGKNKGVLKNVYFNSTNRENGEYSTPIKSLNSNTVGGLVGDNRGGTIANAYITAVGPLNRNGNINIVAGGESLGASGTLENVYYLNVGEYNRNVSGNQGISFNADGSLVTDHTKKISNYLNGVWVIADIDTTKETFNCKGLIYPYPKIKGINHYFDWPVLINTLKYFEEYSDGTKGYYFYNGESITDTLKYDNQDLTVVDEGYVVEVLSKGFYDVKFNSYNTDMISNIESEVFDGKIAIKLKHSQVEKLIKDINITKDGIKPIKIEAFKNGESSSSDILETKGKKTYFNPLFPKQIYYYAGGENVNPVKTFEIRSPRNLLNVNIMGENTTSEKVDYKSDYYKEKQDISNKIYLRDINTKFPYGEDMGVGIGKNTFKFYWNEYGDNTSYYKTRDFDYPISLNDNTELISRVVSIDSKGNEIITEIVETYNVSKEIHRYTMNDYYGTAYKYGGGYVPPSYWNLDAEYEYRTNVKRITRTISQNRYIINLNLKQSISINFGGDNGKQTISGRVPYKWEEGYNLAKSKINNNIISTLYSNYDAGVYFKDGKYYGNEKNAVPVNGPDGIAKRNRIYNLVMNAENGTGGAFGTIESGVTVKNIEFVDPQIRMENGRGGGIVSNINHGVIDNVQVYNKEEKRSLFADKNGNVDTAFLQSGNNSSVNYGSNLGGISGQLVSEKNKGFIAKITNCVVGTNSNNISDIVDSQKTLIYARTATGYGNEWATNRIGGIVGFVYGNAEVISSINIAEINAWYNKANSNALGSPFSVGGIAGSTGIRNIGEQVDSSFTGGWSTRDKGNSPGNIIGCYNAGNVKLKNGWVAGITGYSATGSNIVSCYNTGRINIEKNNGRLEQVPFLSNQPIRIGGIVGEADGAKVVNCYNIGYMSGDISTQSNSAAGSIMALPAYTESTIENCYSLKAVEFPPSGLIGKLWNSAVVNGLNNKDTINSYFSGIFITKNQLRDKSLELVNSSYQTMGYINLKFTKGSSKNYPVFNSSTDSFYIYPQLNSFVYGGVNYKNPHITPWEYIDSEYDAVLNYYEQYSDNTFGYSYLDVFGNMQSSLSNDKIVIKDGYFIEMAKSRVSYKIEIDDIYEAVSVSQDNVVGNKKGIMLNESIIEKLSKKTGYSRMRVYTNVSGEDNYVNRLVGTNTVKGGYGKDIYFDYRFPKEIKYGISENFVFDPLKLKPENEPYYIRSPRHILEISSINAISVPKEFIQESSIDFSKYKGGIVIGNSLVLGEFKGSYNAQGYSILNLKLNKSASPNVAFFESVGEKATVSNLRLVSPQIVGSGNIGVITGENKGKIKNIVIEKPSLISNGTVESNMGSICGDNQGDILDVFIMDYGIKGEATFSGGNYGGGVVGKNSKNLIRVLYTAKAPKLGDNSIPITDINTGRLEDVYFLARSDYNNPNNAIGTAKEESEFKDIDIINWYEWGRKEGYPYPYLVSIKTFK